MGQVYDGVEWNQYNPHFLNPEFYGYGDSIQGQDNTLYVGTMWTEIDYVDKALGHANKITSRFFDGVYDQQSKVLVILPIGISEPKMVIPMNKRVKARANGADFSGILERVIN